MKSKDLNRFKSELTRSNSTHNFKIIPDDLYPIKQKRYFLFSLLTSADLKKSQNSIIKQTIKDMGTPQHQSNKIFISKQSNNKTKNSSGLDLLIKDFPRQIGIQHQNIFLKKHIDTSDKLQSYLTSQGFSPENIKLIDQHYGQDCSYVLRNALVVGLRKIKAPKFVTGLQQDATKMLEYIDLIQVVGRTDNLFHLTLPGKKRVFQSNEMRGFTLKNEDNKSSSIIPCRVYTLWSLTQLGFELEYIRISQQHEHDPSSAVIAALMGQQMPINKETPFLQLMLAKFQALNNNQKYPLQRKGTLPQLKHNRDLLYMCSQSDIERQIGSLAKMIDYYDINVKDEKLVIERLQAEIDKLRQKINIP